MGIEFIVVLCEVGTFVLVGANVVSLAVVVVGILAMVLVRVCGDVVYGNADGLPGRLGKRHARTDLGLIQATSLRNVIRRGVIDLGSSTLKPVASS